MSADTPKKKRGRGRPPGFGFKPTGTDRENVRMMAASGVPETEMLATIINPITKMPITAVTLRKYFREELDTGMLKANMKVIGNLFKGATEPTETHPFGNPILQMFWAKCRLGWREKPVYVTPDGNTPLDTAPSIYETPPLINYDLARRIAWLLSQAADNEAKSAPRVLQLPPV